MMMGLAKTPTLSGLSIHLRILRTSPVLSGIPILVNGTVRPMASFDFLFPEQDTNILAYCCWKEKNFCSFIFLGGCNVKIYDSFLFQERVCKKSSNKRGN